VAVVAAVAQVPLEQVVQGAYYYFIKNGVIKWD